VSGDNVFINSGNLPDVQPYVYDATTGNVSRMHHSIDVNGFSRFVQIIDAVAVDGWHYVVLRHNIEGPSLHRLAQGEHVATQVTLATPSNA